jgi:hypothetical protein
MSSAAEQFVNYLPTRPYCTDDLSSGLQIRPRGTAIKKAYIQQNGPGILRWLVFDVDRPGAALAWEQGDLAPPNFVAVNRENAHAHLVYLLSPGVCKTAAAREKPLRYVAAIERAMTTRLGADRGYAGLITKNPLHPRWRVWEIHDHPYALGELAEYLDLRAVRGAANDSVMPAEAHGLGRNCALFDAGRIWAYSAVRDHWGPNGQELWHKVVLAHLAGINDQFQAPLPISAWFYDWVDCLAWNGVLWFCDHNRSGLFCFERISNHGSDARLSYYNRYDGKPLAHISKLAVENGVLIVDDDTAIDRAQLSEDKRPPDGLPPAVQ